MRQLGTFSLRDLARGAALSDRSIGQYLAGLTHAGILSTDAGRYILRRDTGIEAPRVREDGSLVRSGEKAERLWRAMRILGQFDLRALICAAAADDCPISDAYAAEYTRRLVRAGYLRIAEPGRPGHPARHALVPARYSGPRAPRIQRRPGRPVQVYDPNIERVVWRAGTGEVQ